jgi:hypothetical protein
MAEHALGIHAVIHRGESKCAASFVDGPDSVDDRPKSSFFNADQWDKARPQSRRSSALLRWAQPSSLEFKVRRRIPNSYG